MPTQLERGAGILLPISSLPSDFGIGTLGKAAWDFIDFLADSHQKYWQMLPVGPTSYGDSPYQSFSAFAGNPYFIDLQLLALDGWLEEEEIRELSFGDHPGKVSYEILYRRRFPILKLAAKRYWKEKPEEDFLPEQFRSQLEEYCLYMAIKEYLGGRAWSTWPEPVRRRDRNTLETYRILLEEEIRFWKFCQIQFFKQWKAMKEYANRRGIRLIGDLPIYVAMDSADVWTDPGAFQMDVDLNPTGVAGVPPDAFTELGQLWGNPLYNWEIMEQDGFAWWRRRVEASAALFDVIRIDHFLGFVQYYTVSPDAPDAREGYWRPGPGSRLTQVINEAAGSSVIVAEDLGVAVPGVKKLLAENSYPNMKILEFGFDGGPHNEHAPHNYVPNCLAYLGTHDNETLTGFLQGKTEWQLAYAYEYFGVCDREALRHAMLRSAYGSVAQVTILQMQDLLGLDNSARMNQPGTLGGNWEWRLLPGQLTEDHRHFLQKYTGLYYR